jgi:hypothetical protein
MLFPFPIVLVGLLLKAVVYLNVPLFIAILTLNLIIVILITILILNSALVGLISTASLFASVLSFLITGYKCT